MRTKLKDFQLKGALKIRKFSGRALLADEMGLGKTLQALYWCFKMRKMRPVVIVCPANLKLNWQVEAKKHLNIPTEVLEGRKTWTRPPLSLHQFIIINYDILAHWVEALRKLKPKVLILDEVHYIKNRGTDRYKAVKALSRGIPHVIGISGTPLTNRPSELWPTLNLIRPDLFASWTHYAFRHCQPMKTPWGWKYDGAARLPELHKTLRKNLMIRRLKKNVLTELPAKRRYTIPVRLSDRKEYDLMVRDFKGWLANSKGVPKKNIKAEALVRLGYLKRTAAKLKLQNVFEWLDNTLEATDGKIAVYGIHKVILGAVKERYGKQCVSIDGSTSKRNRQNAVERFQTDPKIRIFVGNMKAAGVGITLTAASTLVNIELDWDPGTHGQVEDRIHRIGQKNTADIYYIVAMDTVEVPLCQLIQDKQAVLDAVLDGGAKLESINIFDQLIKLL